MICIFGHLWMDRTFGKSLTTRLWGTCFAWTKNAALHSVSDLLGQNQLPSKDTLGVLRGILGKAIDASYWTQGIWLSPWCVHPGLNMKHAGCIWFKDDERYWKIVNYRQSISCSYQRAAARGSVAGLDQKWVLAQKTYLAYSCLFLNLSCRGNAIVSADLRGHGRACFGHEPLDESLRHWDRMR